MFLVFDTETTGLPKKWNAPVSDIDNWPRCVQLAWQLHDIKGKLISNHSYLIVPQNFNIPFEAEKIHGISTDLALKIGKNINEVLELFISDENKSEYLNFNKPISNNKLSILSLYSDLIFLNISEGINFAFLDNSKA